MPLGYNTNDCMFCNYTISSHNKEVSYAEIVYHKKLLNTIYKNDILQVYLLSSYVIFH